MTPGVPSYLPGTPGGQPMTPGTGGLDPTSPAIGAYINYIKHTRVCGGYSVVIMKKLGYPV